MFAPENRTPETDLLRDQIRVGDGRFRLIKSLGEGGMGQVWLAEDSQLDGKRVALKFVSQDLMSDPRLINELRHELIRTRDLQDRYIVKVHDWHAHDCEPPFISMEYVEGESLAVMLTRHERGIPYRQVHPLLLHVCQALIHAHEQGIIHRDIKPANILCHQTGTGAGAKLTDFGIGSLVENTASVKIHWGGTVPYMSPSQAQGGPPCAADDIFSLGVTFYQLLTGVLPYGPQGCLVNELTPMTEAFADDGHCHSVPIQVRTMMWSCLQRDASHRPDSVARILTLLKQYPPPEILSARTSRPSPDLRPMIVEPEPWFTLRLALLLLLTLSLGLLYWQRGPLYEYLYPPRLPMASSPAKPTNIPPSPSTALSFTFTNANPAVSLSSLLLRTDLHQRARDGAVHFSTLLPGDYTITAAEEGYDPLTLSLSLFAGPTNIQLGLTRHHGSLSFRISAAHYREHRPTFKLWRSNQPPPAASIAITNPTMVVSDVPAGSYLLSILWPGESATTKLISIEKNKRSSQSFSFGLVNVELPHVITDDGRLRSAEVVCETKNGLIKTNTPATLSLREGERRISFKVEGYHLTNLSVVLHTNKSGRPTNLVTKVTRSSHPLPGDRFVNQLGMTFCPMPGAVDGSNGLWLGRTEVTRGQFNRYVEETGCQMGGMKCLTATGHVHFADRSFIRPGFDVSNPEEHPAVGISWRDAVQFCLWLTRREQAAGRLLPSQSYQLPTARQWQMACELSPPDAQGNFAGPELMDDRHWPRSWSHLLASRSRDRFTRTAPVEHWIESGRPPGGGRFDVQNLRDNVQEWCLDEYHPELNPEHVLAAYDWTLAVVRYTPKTPWRVVCGGSWYDHDPMLWESRTRQCGLENERTDYRGFRLVIVAEAGEVQ